MYLSKYYKESKVKNDFFAIFRRKPYTNSKDFFRHINDTCNNCRLQGHVFKHCNSPIISYGIICYYKDDVSTLDELQYLLIQRKVSIGYTDFIRGKYNYCNKETMLKVYIEEMTMEERNRINTNTFEQLWRLLWIDLYSKTFKNDYLEAKKKFDKLDLDQLFSNQVDPKFITEEFGFPKGRPNAKETNKACAIREFEEETSYLEREIEFICDKDGDDLVYEEMFLGSNGIYYKHVYYLARLKKYRVPILDMTNIHQAGEVNDIVFYNYKKSMNSFRRYDSEKRSVLFEVHKFLTAKR